jgi:mono/diheme cytochrome c family protein
VRPRAAGRSTAAGSLAAAALALGACGGDGGGSGGDVRPGASAGERVFVETGCGSCHVLSAAGADGRSGPDLDARPQRRAAVERVVRDGASGMPAYADQLSAREIREVAAYVASASRAR